MPIHFQSITNDNQDSHIFANIVGPVFDKANSVAISSDKQHFIARSEMIDNTTGNVIGQYVFTVFNNAEKEFHELLDVDITLEATVPTELHFLKKLSGSSDSNEYYEAETAYINQHLELETVNRYTVDGDITDTTRFVYISVFPFEATVYKNIKAFNKKIGFKKKHPIGKTPLTTSGLSETFISPGSIFSSQDNEKEHSSFLLGTVENFRDISISVGDLTYSFVLVQAKTALGIVPVAMGRDVFDLRKLRTGVIIGMRAYIKADLSKPEDWQR